MWPSLDRNVKVSRYFSFDVHNHFWKGVQRMINHSLQVRRHIQREERLFLGLSRERIRVL